MKKLVMTLAAGLFATALMAEVKSANVVGYSTLTFKEGWNLIGVQFEAIGAGGGTIDVQNLFTGVTLEGMNDAGVMADYMQIWNNQTGFYNADLLYWSDNAANELENVWITADYLPATHAFHAGDAFWVYTSVGGSAAGAVTLGQVSAVDTPISIIPGWNLVANPFPVALEINVVPGMEVNGLVSMNDAGVLADYMQIWNNQTGFYNANLLYWSDNAANELENVWITADYLPAVGVSVEANGAFWVYHGGSGAELTFTSPL